VMELLQGEELSARLKRERQLPLPLVVEIVVQLCRALTVAHEAGVIHRDLKPANVFLCKSEDEQEVFVKLLDFGVAKAALEHEDTQGTRAGTIFGTPGYMSPEQIVGETELDSRSDLWSLAVIAYRMAVGRTPFSSGGLGELGLRILTTNPPLPSSVRPDLPKAFDEWMKRGLSKQREYRFSTATELANALVEAEGKRDSIEPQEEVTVTEGPSSEESATYAPIFRTAPEPEPVVERSRFRRFLPLLLAAVVLSVAGAGVASGMFRKRSAAAQEQAKPVESIATAQSGPAESAPSPPTANAADVAAPADSSQPAEAETKLPTELVRPTTPTSAPPPRPVRTQREKRPPGSVAKQAGELWNKKDEL